MKVLHLPTTFFPFFSGGTETFVKNLIDGLTLLNINSVIAIHQDPEGKIPLADYTFEGIQISVLPAIKRQYINQWDLKVESAPGFVELIKKEKPDVVHFHDTNNGASLSHLEIVKSLGIKTVVSYHSPGQSCPQRSLMEFGSNTCDGVLDGKRCSYCLLIGKGIPKIICSLLSRPHPPITKYSNVNKVFSNRTLVDLFIKSVNTFYGKVNFIQVHADWCKKMLVDNGVNPQKIAFIPQGINDYKFTRIRTSISNPVQILFVGRCNYIKGAHILIDAIKLIPPKYKIQISILGSYWDRSHWYGKKYMPLIEGDVRFFPPKVVPPSEVVEYMSRMDVCIVPSIWQETGPLVLKEAQACGLPVLGSNCGGIAENIINYETGLLFESGNSVDLASKIIELIENKDLYHKLTKKQNLPSFVQMADGFNILYNQCTTE
jgi:glycosyltransferase involved in cell wall biosynthesis